MIYNLDNPWEVQNLKEYLANLIKKGGMVELKRKSPLRSLAQNRYCHLLLGYFSTEFGYTIEETKFSIFKKQVNPEIFLRRRVNKRGEEIQYVRSTAELTTAEMNTAIERFRNYSAIECQFYLPAPNENQFLEYIEKEIEKHKDYV